jgi:transposase-like protein
VWRCSEAVNADIRKRMSPPACQSVARISEETGIHIGTLYAWRKAWRLEGEVVWSISLTALKDRGQQSINRGAAHHAALVISAAAQPPVTESTSRCAWQHSVVPGS